MKNSSYGLLFLLSLLSCERKGETHLLISSYLSNENSFTLERTIASQNKSGCLKDSFTMAALKKEIAELEKKYKSDIKVSGRWRHLELADLPLAQANFLKAYGKRIGDLLNPDAIDYSSCQQVPCIFNKIYGNENSIAGYVHYLWYLKFGHLLGAANVVYGQDGERPGYYNGKRMPLNSYLYNEDELYGFWRLSKMLQGPYTQLIHLTEIHRVPRGESFDTVTAERKIIEAENQRRREQGITSLIPISNSEVCGKAWSNGYVILQDLCLTLKSGLEEGNFYQSITHELNHQIDFHEARQLKVSYRSHQKDYLEISGFYLTEYKDEKGETKYQWAHAPGAKMVSAYAGGLPQESFAETLSYFRHDGTTTKRKITSTHWDFTSNNYFESKHFDTGGLIWEWLSGPDYTRLAYDTVNGCSKEDIDYHSTYLLKTDFKKPPLSAMMNCLSFKTSEIARSLSETIKATDPQGCSFFNDSNKKKEWELDFKKSFIPLLERYLDEYYQDSHYFERIKDFYQLLPDQRMAAQSYIRCYGELDADSCYQREVLKAAEKEISKMNLAPALGLELSQLYFQHHPFGQIQEHVTKGYLLLLNSHQELKLRTISELWGYCYSLPANDSSIPKGEFDFIGEGYMVSSMFNCLNLALPEAAKKIVDSIILEGKKVENLKEELILMEMLLPVMEKELRKRYENARMEEFKRVQLFIDKNLASIKTSLLDDFSWLNGKENTLRMSHVCEQEIFYRMKLQLYFHLLKDFASNEVKAVCNEVYQSEAFSKWVENRRREREENALVQLETKVLELAGDRAQHCLKLYPIDTSINRSRFKAERDACLINEWSAIEERAIRQLGIDPSLKNKLDSNRRRMQLRVMKENF
jgi:hypothetical protein